MKADKLMIGDFVTFKDCQNDEVKPIVKIWQLNEDNKAFVSIDSDDALEEIEIDDEIIGIPLTPEILEKNGFERRDGLVEDGFLPFILDRNDTEELYEVVVEWRDYYDNGAADAFNVEIVDECWKLHIGCGMKTYISTQDIIFVHELQHALKLCGIDKSIEL